ncbi:TIGR02281 family clan AA aspartic protease [Variovorax soli]|uniref:TIGR02281 family clan AA aspartic protease n=1 Tax=Variovorax soli TaxID=376815 RepID=UPI000A0769D0
MRPQRPLLATLLPLAMAAGLAPSSVWAESVMLTGTIGNRAILIVDGAAPRTVAAGEKLGSVKVVSVQGDQAVVEVGGQRTTLRMDQPASVGGGGGGGANGSRIVLPAGSGGHFMTAGAINGRSVNFMVDTGATLVSISAADALRIGLDYKKSSPVQINTANGVGRAFRVRLNTVRVGDVEVYDVDALVSEQPMPYVLLGNSFINRFSMQREGDQMVLQKRY